MYLVQLNDAHGFPSHVIYLLKNDNRVVIIGEVGIHKLSKTLIHIQKNNRASVIDNLSLKI